MPYDIKYRDRDGSEKKITGDKITETPDSFVKVERSYNTYVVLHNNVHNISKGDITGIKQLDSAIFEDNPIKVPSVLRDTTKNIIDIALGRIQGSLYKFLNCMNN